MNIYFYAFCVVYLGLSMKMKNNKNKVNKMLTFLLHIKNVITQAVCNNPVATGFLFSILCCLPWLLMKKKKPQNKMNIIKNNKSNCSLFFHT